MGIQGNRLTVGLGGGFRRSLGEKEKKPQGVAIFGVAWLPSHGSLQAGQNRPVGEVGGEKLAADEPQIRTDHEKEGQRQGNLPGRTRQRYSHVSVYRKSAEPTCWSR